MTIVMDTHNGGSINKSQNYSYYDSSIVLPRVGRLPSMNNNLQEKETLQTPGPNISSGVGIKKFMQRQNVSPLNTVGKENGLRKGKYSPQQQTLLESRNETIFSAKKQTPDTDQPLFIPQPPSEPKTKPTRTHVKDLSIGNDGYEIPIVSKNQEQKQQNLKKKKGKEKGKAEISKDTLANEQGLINMYKDFLHKKFNNNVGLTEDSLTEDEEESDFSISSLSGNETDDDFGGNKTLTKTDFEPLYSLPIKDKTRKLERPQIENSHLNKIVISHSNMSVANDNIINTLTSGSLPDLRSLDKLGIQKVTHVAKNESEAESEPGAKLSYKFRPLPSTPGASSKSSSNLYETIDGFSKQKSQSSPEKKEGKRTFKDIAHLMTLIPRLTTNAVRSRKQDHKLADISQYLPDKKLKIFIGTWNMKGTKGSGLVRRTFVSANVHPRLMKSLPDSLDDFLLPPESIYLQDLYVIGTQEGTPFRREWQVRLQETFGPSHVLMQASNFGVLNLSIFVRRELVWFCSSIEQDTIATRMGHKIKTKGALAMSLNIFGTSFLFITSHFTSHEGKLRDRINDYKSICQNIQLPYVDPNKGNEKDVTTRFDRVFWFGDFNFRVKKPRDTVDKMLIKYHKNEELLIKELLNHDQLNDIFQRGKIFHGFTEAPITFMPTYKFDVNTNRYDTSSKQRVPSWTDRVVHKSVPPHQLTSVAYNSCNSIKVSDHRPVYSMYETTIEPYNSEFNTVAGASFDRDIYVEANLRRTAPTGSQEHSHVCTIL